MADLKATSFRISEEDLEKFKQFMEQEGIKTQADGFKSIMQSVEMAQAKNLIKDRAKDVEVFQDTINRLMSYYLNSLEVNQNSEERIREELQKELSTKDNTISIMYEQLQELKADKSNLESNFKEIGTKSKELQEQLQKANVEITDKQSQLDIANRNNNNLQDQVAEYKQYKEQYSQLDKELKTVKSNNEKLVTNKILLETTIAKLKDKINNDGEMLEFYKANNVELKDSIKTLEQQHKQDIENIRADNKKALEEQQKAITEQLQSKQDVEVAKKDLEVQKLQNQIEQQLKAEKAKQQHKPVNNNIKSK